MSGRPSASAKAASPRWMRCRLGTFPGGVGGTQALGVVVGTGDEGLPLGVLDVVPLGIGIWLRCCVSDVCGASTGPDRQYLTDARGRREFGRLMKSRFVSLDGLLVDREALTVFTR